MWTKSGFRNFHFGSALAFVFTRSTRTTRVTYRSLLCKSKTICHWNCICCDCKKCQYCHYCHASHRPIFNLFFHFQISYSINFPPLLHVSMFRSVTTEAIQDIGHSYLIERIAAMDSYLTVRITTMDLLSHIIHKRPTT